MNYWNTNVKAERERVVEDRETRERKPWKKEIEKVIETSVTLPNKQHSVYGVQMCVGVWIIILTYECVRKQCLHGNERSCFPTAYIIHL